MGIPERVNWKTSRYRDRLPSAGVSLLFCFAW